MKSYNIIALILFLSSAIFAEGSKELARNGHTAALYIGKSDQGNFANYADTTGKFSKLNVHILDPTSEFIYLGFSQAREPGGANISYRFYVKDPNGAIIYKSEVIAEEGQIKTLQQGIEGPSNFSTLGYRPITITQSDLLSEGWTGAGDYSIEFEGTTFKSPFLVLFWDINVVTSSGLQLTRHTGRVWSKSWVLFTPNENPLKHFDTPFEGAFYIVAPEVADPTKAFVTQIDFNKSEFHAAAFAVAFNEFGVYNTGRPIEDRKSRSQKRSVLAQHPIFLNDPIEIYETAILGEIKSLRAEGCLPDNYCIYFEAEKSGEIELLLDLFGDNFTYDPNTADVLIVFRLTADDINQPICIPWDGLNGFGEPHQAEDYDHIRTNFTFRQGLFHFPIFDCENNRKGFTINLIRPAGPPPLLYYDDSYIPFESGTLSPNFNLVGCATPCHTWQGDENFHSYGNKNTINSWWSALENVDRGSIELYYDKFLVTESSMCQGDSIVLQDSVITSGGNHTFYSTSRAGCDSVHVMRINIIGYKAEIGADFATLNCYHPDIILNGNLSQPTQNINFIWSDPNGARVGNSTNSQIEIGEAGNYTLTIVEKTSGCSDQTNIEIDQDFIKPVITVLDIPLYRCKNENKSIFIDIDEAIYEPTINWSTADGLIANENDGFSPVIKQPGLYEVNSSYTENGCESIIQISVLRDTSSYLEIIGDNIIHASFCTTIQFNYSVNQPDQVAYHWTPDTLLSCSGCLNPTIDAVGNYKLNLTAVDTNNCTETKNVQLQLNEDYNIYIPSAFSPNNDGINDEFRMFSSPCSVEIEEFAVFNRWGDRIFKQTNFLSTDNHIKWNGFVGDQAVELGVYPYYAVLKIHDGSSSVLSGMVQLVK